MPTHHTSHFHIARKHIHRRLLLQLIIFPILAVIMLGLVGSDIFNGNISLILALLSLVIGLVIGWAVGRMFAIRWHEDTEKVIMGMDRTGFIIIVIYILFSSFKKQIFGEFVPSSALAAFTFSNIAGIAIGRFFSLGKSVLKILQQQHIV